MSNIDLKSFKGFCIVKGDRSKEAMRLLSYTIRKDITLIKVKTIKENCPDGYVPLGSVEWCMQSLGRNIFPEYYPEWLSFYFKRKIWNEDTWPLKRVFIKPRDRYKRFTGFCTKGTYSKKKKPPFVCSDIIYPIANEWRYYISNGKILCAEWYWGDENLMPLAPEITVEIPSDYCGAVDFGYNRILGIFLIEAQHPFACGWYGDYENDHLYFQWLIDGWEYMLRKVKYKMQ